MKPKDISEATDPLLRGSMPAMRRAAELARKIAIQTNTGLIVMREGKLTRLSGEALRAGAWNDQTLSGSGQ